MSFEKKTLNRFTRQSGIGIQRTTDRWEYCELGVEGGKPFVYLPEHDEEFTARLLQNGKHMLITDSEGLWLVGLDEAPFSTTIDEYTWRFQEVDPYQILKKRGERAFYKSLIPPLVVELGELFGTEPVRQGEVHAVPVPLEKFSQFFRLSKFYDSEAPLKFGAVNRKILGRSHKLKGRAVFLNWDYRHDDLNVCLGFGVLSAADHKPLVLAGPHLIMVSPAVSGD